MVDRSRQLQSHSSKNMFKKCLIVLLLAGCCLAYPKPAAQVKLYYPQNSQDVGAVELEGTGNMLAFVNRHTKFLLSKLQKVNYFMATQICKQYGMKLIKVDSWSKHKLVSEAIANYTTNGPFWIAGNRLGDGETWTWPGGTPISEFYWNQGEPNNAKGTEKCIEIYHQSAQWDDQDCLQHAYFICENKEIPIYLKNDGKRQNANKLHTNSGKAKKGQDEMSYVYNADKNA